MNNKGEILIVDDAPANLTLLVNMLTEQGYEVRAAINGSLALMALEQATPNLVLLDVSLPDISGYEVCSRIKENSGWRDIPIIFISALDGTLDKVRAFNVGGVDYVTKPFQIEELLARVETQITLYSQRREIEQLRLKERIYFENLNHLKDQLLSTASHDLKSPISLIQGFTEVLEDRPDFHDADSQRILAAIRRSADRMLELVHNLLDMTRAETDVQLELQTISLADFLANLISNYEVKAMQSGIRLELNLPPASLQVVIDPARMGQVLDNLLSNAFKYTPSGGYVRINIENGEDTVCINIADTGIGIPADELASIFNKFYRVRRDEVQKVTGTGLGLAIARSIVDKHRGSISVQSDVGRGSIFTVCLPQR